MSLAFADPDDLHAVAGRISSHACRVRQVAARLAARSSGAAWHGVAAEAFLAQMHWVLAALRASADRLEDAADSLRRLATKVATFLLDARRALTASGRLAGDAVHLATDAFSSPSAIGGDARSTVEDLRAVGGGIVDVAGDLGEGVIGLVGL